MAHNQEYMGEFQELFDRMRACQASLEERLRDDEAELALLRDCISVLAKAYDLLETRGTSKSDRLRVQIAALETTLALRSLVVYVIKRHQQRPPRDTNHDNGHDSSPA